MTGFSYELILRFLLLSMHAGTWFFQCSQERMRIRALEALETKSDMFYAKEVGGKVVEGGQPSPYGFKPDGKCVDQYDDN